MSQHFGDIDMVDDFKSTQIDMEINGESGTYDLMMPHRAILYHRRIELGLTQQQVADRARIKLEQYQKYESGERSMESASFRIGMAISDVLKLDPHRFTGFKD